MRTVTLHCPDCKTKAEITAPNDFKRDEVACMACGTKMELGAVVVIEGPGWPVKDQRNF